MIFGIPAVSFWVFAVWPIFYVAISFFFYFRMVKTDELEEEYERMKEKGELPQ